MKIDLEELLMTEKQVITNDEINLVNLRKNVEHSLKSAEKVLYEIDTKIDQLEGKSIYEVMINIQDLLLDWNLIGHTFATNGIQDWIESEKEEEN